MDKKTSLLFIVISSILLFHLLNHPPPVQYTLVNPPAYLTKEGVSFIDKCDDNYLPKKVRDAKRHIINIEIQFKKKIYIHNPESSVFRSAGSGFMIKPGIIVSARHTLLDPMIDFRRYTGSRFFVKKQGLPYSYDYDYSFIGTTDINGKHEKFKLSLIAMGEMGKHEDVIILRADNYPSQLKPLEIGPELKEKEIVYNGGFVFQTSLYPLKNGYYDSVVSNVNRCSFQGRVLKKNTDLPVNKVGVSIYYDLNIAIEGGYSGGPVLNSEGQVSAVTLEMTRNFVNAVTVNDAMKLMQKWNIK